MQNNNYDNPLDNFRSYSYQFVLTVASTSEANRKLLAIDEATKTQPFLGAVNNARLGDKVGDPNDPAYLLIDTRRYSQYSITSYEANHIYGTGGTGNPSVPTSAARMKIFDSTGLSFFNFLADTLKNKIQSSRASAFFMLAIIFVGHKDDAANTTEVISTCYTPLFLTSLTFSFDSSGSTFDIEFQEIEGNPGRGNPQMIDLGDLKALSSEGRPSTVGGLIQAFEERLNLNSLRFFEKYSNEANSRAGATTDSGLAGKLVQYMITLPKEWSNFSIDTATKEKHIEQAFIVEEKRVEDRLSAAKKAAADKAAEEKLSAAKKAEALRLAKMSADDKIREDDKKLFAGTSKPAAFVLPPPIPAPTPKRNPEDASYLSFSSTMTVPSVIKMILESSQSYLDLSSKEKAKAGQAIVHKTVSNATSNQNSYVMHFDIYPFKVKKPAETDTASVQSGTKTTAPTIVKKEIIKNLIKYDYLFSGNNSHVLDLHIEFSPNSEIGLDTDLDMGGSRLKENANVGQNTAKVEDKSTGAKKTETFNPLFRPGEPIFIPFRSKDQQQGYSGLKTEEYKKEESQKMQRAKQEHTTTLATLHFVGSLQVQMSVRGNPNLIRKYADRNIRGGVPEHYLSLASTELKKLSGTGASSNARSVFDTTTKSAIATAKESYFNKYVLPKHESISKTDKEDALLGGGDISSNCVFVKLNIMAPNVDYTGQFIEGESQFVNKFFYNGVYLLAGIHHEFNNGSFKHNMMLIPFDLDGSFSEATTLSGSASASKKVIV